jgi:hypothetical protein
MNEKGEEGKVSIVWELQRERVVWVQGNGEVYTLRGRGEEGIGMRKVWNVNKLG